MPLPASLVVRTLISFTELRQILRRLARERGFTLTVLLSRKQFLGLGDRLLLAGVGLGMLGAWGAGRAMQNQLYGVGAVHAGVLAATAVVMMLVVLLATFLPSHRASRVSPIEALRED